MLSTPMSFVTMLEQEGKPGAALLKKYKQNIDKPISAVPLQIWEFFNDPYLQDLVWGASLFLLLFVLSLNLIANYLSKKWNQ